MNYVFMTDASCDLTQELINEIGVEVLPMNFIWRTSLIFTIPIAE